MMESDSKRKQLEEIASKRSPRPERRDTTNATAAETGPTRRQWGKSALAMASASLMASGCGKRTDQPLTSKSPGVTAAEPRGLRNELIVKVVKGCKDAKGTTFDGYEFLRGLVQVCTRHNSAIIMILSRDSDVDSIHVSQKAHPASAPPTQKGFHNFDHLFAVHPGSPYSDDNKAQSFELTKTKPAVFVLKTIQDPEALKPRELGCAFNKGEARPHARCIRFYYRLDPKGEPLRHCDGAPDHTDYHIEC